MCKANRMVLLTVGMMLSAAAAADRAKSPNSDAETKPVISKTIDSLLAASAYDTQWQLDHSYQATSFSDDQPQPIAEINFHDGRGLARVARIRNLSFLTLGEFGRQRLFLGVNEEGLVGLHCNAFSGHGDQRYLEIVRMPYLQKSEPVDE